MSVGPLKRRLPAYVHDLVAEVGSQSVFWATARSPGRRPAPGETLPTWRNRVVASENDASQSTGSNQPIWRGNRLEFAGDDYYDKSNFEQDPDALTIAGVVSFGDYSATRCVWGHRSSGNPFILLLYFSSSDKFRLFIEDGSQQRELVEVPKPTLDDRFAFVLQADLTTSTSLTLEASTGSDSFSGTTDGDFSSTKRAIGRDPEFGTEHVGDMYEMLRAQSTSPDPQDLLATLEAKWRI